MNESLARRMQQDWDDRAREDAHYYVAFGRRNQSDEEFFASARDEVRSFLQELRRLPPGNPRARRALEIGCGPGRLMRPLSCHFGEIHGVDISCEMVRMAREKLRDLPHAHVHHAPASDLRMFADDAFDFVYSYAVFQHIPSREIVFNYLWEARRVLKEGGLLRCQINGLPESAPVYDTWSGVRISAAEVAQFARQADMQLLALEGSLTQYMWTTMVKRAAGWTAALAASSAPSAARIRRITNAHSSEPVVPTRGRFASISVWIENLPPAADLNNLLVRVAGRPAFACYIGPPEADGLQQVNAYLPEGLSTGLASVTLDCLEHPLCPPAPLRLIPPPPPVPRLVSVRDGISLLSGRRIVTGSVKMLLEEVRAPEQLRVEVDGAGVRDLEFFCIDPRLPAYEVNFRLPETLAAGDHQVRLSLGSRLLGIETIEVVGEQHT